MLSFLAFVFLLLTKFHIYLGPNQELKIEGEQTEVLEEDNLDLMLPTKKKKSKKVDFDEGEPLEKDDGEN